MSLLNKASLIQIPSGYKDGTLYSAKPINGDGDLDFTRSNDTATRVNSAGLIEKVRTNLLLQSNTLSDAAWILSNATITGGQAGYDETNNGWVLTRVSTSGFLRQNLVQSTLGVLSVYAKADAKDWFRIRVTSTATSSAYFDLSSGTIGTVTSGETATITSVGNGWYRCTLTYSATTSDVRFYVADDDNDVSGTDGSVFIQAAQWELGDIATDYIPTTSAAVSVGMLANVPRLDYSGGGCPKLLLEPQRSNLVTYSEQLDNAAWSKTGVTISANVTTSPDGYTNADKIVGAASAGDKIAFQSLTITSAQAFTLSAFFKKSEYKLAFLRAGGQTGQPYVIYNLDTQAVVSTSGASSTKIEDYGNGWYRVSLTYNSASGTSVAAVVSFAPDSGYTLTAFNVLQYTGDGTSGGFVWGCQLEANGGSYATSYIPTLSASVTRGADACFKTGISSLIGQTEGTVYYEISALDLDSSNWRTISVSDGTTNNRISFYFTGRGTANEVRALVRAGAVNYFSEYYNGATITNTIKVAIAYASNDAAFYVNGVQVATGSSVTVPACSNFVTAEGSSGAPMFGNLNQAILFPTRLTNDELASLTTL